MPPKTDSDTKRLVGVSVDVLDPTQRELEPRQGAVGFSLASVRSIDKPARSITAVVSTGSLDRYEEIVEPRAFEKHLPAFLSNPVFVAGHTYSGWSGEATVIGHWTDVAIGDAEVVATCVFAETALAEEYWRLYSEGHMRAFSVGWITHQTEMREMETPGSEGKKRRIRVFTEVELIEISAVAIPANREALVRAASMLAGATERSSDPGAPGTEGEAETIRNAIKETVDEAVSKAVRETLKQQLNAEPGGMLCGLIQDVVDAAQRHEAHGYEDDDVQTSGGGSRPQRAGVDEQKLKAALRAILKAPG